MELTGDWIATAETAENAEGFGGVGSKSCLVFSAPIPGTLASVNISGPYRVGKYGVHLQDLEQVGVKALWQAVEQPDLSVVVIDEIGKMELVSPAFREAVLAALDGPKVVLATVMARSHPWVDRLKGRDDVMLVEVTLANREALPKRILGWLSQSQADAGSI